METVTHHGRTIAYRRWFRGDADDAGPTVLLVHGSGGSRGVWKAQSRLGSERPVVALDLSGHGESDDIDADPGGETLAAYVDDVVAVARETDARVLVGNSLGGAVAMTLALERDLPLDGLVLTGTGAKLSVLEDLLVWLEEDFERAVEFLHEPDHLFHDADERHVELSKKAMHEAGQAVTSRDFRTSHQFDVRDDLGAIDVPTLAVVGEHDRLTPRRYHDYLADHIPDCDVAVVDDAAHLAMLERPAAFNDAVDEFLASL
ncbi:Pimeloyl-ACP methyl ester carboxylesterase [Halogranum amylolyticum]|uniref:Pimeloyl-ACP methyl ester carboxylesterase n=1 Tax=Halogranum amylolyticum TaxID=660520 RepID=A0A1H8RY04_9EURY|nr:alpha/beta hydrolase [Halogranum amylolyticum]SEO71255.1 Pimeloyl-ACP methyl ester carboxylesterase [Halogranum amylolyticum]